MISVTTSPPLHHSVLGKVIPDLCISPTFPIVILLGTPSPVDVGLSVKNAITVLKYHGPKYCFRNLSIPTELTECLARAVDVIE